jgi:hypothetical protein
MFILVCAILCSPNEEFGRPDKHLMLPKRRFWKAGQASYAPQTKILEGGTKDEIRIFAALFNGS